MEPNLESTVIDISTIPPPAFICAEVGHVWDYPLAEDGDGDTVYYRTCLWCGKREEGKWERKGLTSEKMRRLMRMTLESLSLMRFGYKVI